MQGVKKSLIRVLCDSLALAFLIIFLIIGQALEVNGIVTKRGFYCDDESIRYPYRPDTVPTWALVVGSVGIPLVALVAGNIYEAIPGVWREAKGRNERAPIVLKGIRIPPWILRLGYQVRWFAIGMLATLMLTQLLKIMGGRLRPHFLAVCQPDFAAINCTDVSGFPAYITSYQCKEPESSSSLINARLSWPSGHSSTAAFGLIFASLYFASIPSFYCRSGVKLVLFITPILLSVMVASSRITDFRHHPTDVLSGYILGLLVCLLVVFYHLEFFGWKKARAQQEETKTAVGAD
ncbi:hypothetical protein EMCRGX_G034494 [Ephydatia muelleri]|eukprot:Em0023g406a